MTQNQKNISFGSGKIRPFQHVVFKEPMEKLGSLIFVHPPKVGGTNIVSLVEAVSKVQEDIHPVRFAVPRVEGVSPNRIEKGWIGGMKKLLAEHAASPDKVAEGKNFISGHFPFGAHEYLQGNFHYILLVREPVARELSALKFDVQRGYVPVEEAEQYIDTALSNPQTLMLAGREAMNEACTEEIYDKAVANLEHFFVLSAPTEETDMFMNVLAGLQGWGPIAMSREQVTSTVAIDLSPEHRERLEEKHAFDIRLHKLVKDRWEQWKEAHVASQEAYAPDTNYLTLTPQFVSNKTPEWMTLQAIEAHNEAAPDLVEVQQKHAGLPPEPLSVPPSMPQETVADCMGFPQEL
jgi:hypothetical protein